MAGQWQSVAMIAATASPPSMYMLLIIEVTSCILVKISKRNPARANQLEITSPKLSILVGVMLHYNYNKELIRC